MSLPPHCVTPFNTYRLSESPPARTTLTSESGGEVGRLEVSSLTATVPEVPPQRKGRALGPLASMSPQAGRSPQSSVCSASLKGKLGPSAVVPGVNSPKTLKKFRKVCSSKPTAGRSLGVCSTLFGPEGKSEWHQGKAGAPPAAVSCHLLLCPHTLRVTRWESPPIRR